MTAPLIIRGQWGLGDNIFARPFIRAVAARRTVFLETPWPELFADFPVRFIRAERRLRTQMRNVQRQEASRWTRPPLGAQEVRIGYGHHDLIARGIVRTLEGQLPLMGTPFRFDLPSLPASPVRSRRPIAIVRPVTIRAEWRNEARNPDPVYVSRIAAALRKTHHVIAVADLSPGQEWLAGEMPPHDRAFIGGELDVMQLLALTAAADVVIGGVGWIVPATLAAGVKSFIVLGGHGAHNSPRVITDPRMNCSQLGFAIPERFCPCFNMMHTCDKRISNFRDQWNAWVHSVGLNCAI